MRRDIRLRPERQVHVVGKLAGVGDGLQTFEDEEAVVGEEEGSLFFGQD